MGTALEHEGVVREDLDTADQGPFSVPISGGWLRLALRAPALLATTAGVWLAWLVTRVIAAPWPAARRRSRALLFRFWGRALQAILGFEVEVRGRAPKAPCFVVSNHLSWVDIPLIAGHFEGAFVAKAELAEWPLAGAVIRSMNTIFVDRERGRDIVRVNALVERALDDGVGVVIFAEGCSTRGERVEPFKSPLLEPAVRLGRPVYPATVYYETPPGNPPASHLVCYWGDVGFVEHAVRLMRQPSYRAVLTFGAEPVTGRDRKQLAERLRRAVAAPFEPIDV